VLRGTVVIRYIKCGRKSCRLCQEGRRHGPSYYLSIRGEDGKTHMVYIPKERLEEVRAATRAWKQLKDAMASMVEVNKELVEALRRVYGEEEGRERSLKRGTRRERGMQRIRATAVRG